MSADPHFFGAKNGQKQSNYGQLYVAITPTQDNLAKAHNALRTMKKKELSPLQKTISSPQRESKPSSIIINIPCNPGTRESMATAEDIQRVTLAIWKKFQENEVEFCLLDDNPKGQRIACDYTLVPFSYSLNEEPKDTLTEPVSNVYLSRQEIQANGIEIIPRLELHQSRLQKMKKKSFDVTYRDQEKTTAEEKIIAALETSGEFKQELFDELYQLWDETPGTQLDKAKALLDDYIGLDPVSCRINSLFTRHHCEQIAILKEKIENKTIRTLTDLLVPLKDITLANQYGHVSAITAIIFEKALEEIGTPLKHEISHLTY